MPVQGRHGRPGIVLPGIVPDGDVVIGSGSTIYSSSPNVAVTYQQLLKTYNPLIYLPLNEAAGTPVDHASGSQIGPPGGHWSTFCAGSPVPQTFTLPDGNHLTYGNVGPTTDGRTCIGWSAASRIVVSWTSVQDMPMFGTLPDSTITSVIYWYKRGVAGNYFIWGAQAAGVSSQTKLAFNEVTEVWQPIVQDSGSNVYAPTLAVTLADGNWHLVGENWYGVRAENSLGNLNLYIDGAFVHTFTFQVAGNNYGPWSFNGGGVAVGGDPLSATAARAAGYMQDFAVLPGGTNACAPLAAADYAALYAAR